MGTITIIEYGNTGSTHTREVSVADLSKQTGRNTDATTSTAVESITLKANTRVVSILAVEAHRVSMVDATCATTYVDIPASVDGSTSDFGVEGGKPLYYRLNA